MDDYESVPAKVIIGGVWMPESHYNALQTKVYR